MKQLARIKNMGNSKQPKTCLKHNQKGAAAIEFAMVAPVFLALMFSIFEIGWVFFAESVSERASHQAARLLRTGQIQQIDITNDPDAQQEAVRDEVCKFAVIFGDCNDTLTIEVEQFASFAELAASNEEITCKDANQEAQDQINFEPGDGGTIVRVRTCILYKTLNPVIGLSLSNTNGASNRLISQFVFRTENFERNVRNN